MLMNKQHDRSINKRVILNKLIKMVLLSLQHAQELGIARNAFFEQSFDQMDFWDKLIKHKRRESLLKEELTEAVAWMTRNDEKAKVAVVFVRGTEVHIFVRGGACRHVYEWGQAEIGWHGVTLFRDDISRLFFVTRHFINEHRIREERREDSFMLQRLHDEQAEDIEDQQAIRSYSKYRSMFVRTVDSDEEQVECGFRAAAKKNWNKNTS